jgi:peptidoglycan/xylan/chitin deacetylase (PgdA/CDA1 family)
MPATTLKRMALQELSTPDVAPVALPRQTRRQLSWEDISTLIAKPPPIGELAGDPLSRLGLSPEDLNKDFDDPPGPVQYLGKAKYLNGANSVVTHMVDDSNEHLPTCLDAMDRYGIKATAFVTTGYKSVMPKLWPRLRQAVANGHEIGSHSRLHPCRMPPTSLSCFRSLTWDEVDGSRKDILEHAHQCYVWSWAYPCGHCANHRFIQRKIASAGYLVARAYPDELEDRHVVPDLQTYDSNPYAARYTQVVQKSYTKLVPDKGELTISGLTDLPRLNAKFDEVHANGGIYSFLSHPQMLDYGPESFYEQHLSHLAGRDDIWYVPIGPLYAYRKLFEETQVQGLKAKTRATRRARFAVFNHLDGEIYNGSITLKFRTSGVTTIKIVVDGKALEERAGGQVDRWDGQYFRISGEDLLVTLRPNAIVEFQLPDRGHS